MTIDRQGTTPSQDERNWAMLAHLSALLTVLTAVATGGPGYVIALIVPLALFLYFSGRSDYVAYHALQATVFQALAGVAYVAITALAGALLATAWVVTGVLTIFLVGIFILPAALGLTLMATAELLGFPILAVAYAVRGAYLTYDGLDFAYPFVGKLVARAWRRPVHVSEAKSGNV